MTFFLTKILHIFESGRINSINVFESLIQILARAVIVIYPFREKKERRGKRDDVLLITTNNGVIPSSSPGGSNSLEED